METLQLSYTPTGYMEILQLSCMMTMIITIVLLMLVDKDVRVLGAIAGIAVGLLNLLLSWGVAATVVIIQFSWLDLGDYQPQRPIEFLAHLGVLLCTPIILLNIHVRNLKKYRAQREQDDAH